MFFTIFLTLYIIICLLLLVVVLLQQGKGGDIAAAFGGSSSQAAFGARAGATVLTRTTTILGVLFMLGSLGLAIMGSEGGFGSSVVGGVDAPPAATTPASPAGGDPTALPLAPTGVPPTVPPQTPPPAGGGGGGQ
jgi:preprotein translocase subunit SecG